MSVPERQSGVAAAFDLACRWLGRTRLSETEVRARLTNMGFTEQTVERTADRLRELGFIDDRELARTRAQTLAARGYGDAWIERDLKGRGVPEDCVESAVACLAPETDRASDWIERHGGGRDPRALWRTLLRRGFRPENVEGVLPAAGWDDDEWSAD